MGKPVHNTSANAALPVADQIKEIVKGFQCSAPMKTAHLVNVALATLKWLMTNAESDEVRFKAAEALLALPPMQAKLGLMRTVVDQPHLGRESRPAVIAKRLKAVMEASPEQAQRLLAMVAEAEKEQRSPAKSEQRAA